MGFLDNLFGSSDKETTTKVEYPKWVQDASKANYGIAAQIASRPYAAYPFQRIAGFTGDQKDAMGMLRGMAPSAWANGSGFKVPRMIDEIGKGGTVEAYMNPFVDNVLDRTQQRIRDTADYAKQWQAGMGSHSDGAFGDARHGVADSLIEKEAIQTMGDQAAQGYATAYDNAQTMRNADINRMYQTEDMQLKQQQELLQYIDSLYRSGSNQQALDQNSLDLGYQDFQRQWNYPIEQYNLLTAALTQSPYGSQTTNTEPGPSKAGQIMGGLGGLLSLFL